MTQAVSSAAMDPATANNGAGCAGLSYVWEGDRATFAKAYVKAQLSMESVKKASSNPAFKSKYADLSAVVEGVVPALNAAGIGVIQIPGFDPATDMVKVTTIFLHESGSSLTGELALRPSRTDPQGIISATTYGRRVSLLAMSGAAPEDDDGNASSGPRQQRRPECPSAAAQFAADQLRATKTKDEFTHFWNGQKAGLKETLVEADYAHVVGVMQAEAGRFAEKPAENDTFPGDMQDAA